jgi:hypothetical protein
MCIPLREDWRRWLTSVGEIGDRHITVVKVSTDFIGRKMRDAGHLSAPKTPHAASLEPPVNSARSSFPAEVVTNAGNLIRKASLL